MSSCFNALKRCALKRISEQRSLTAQGMVQWMERKEKQKDEEKEMGIKLVLLVIFFAIMVGVGIYSRRHIASVDGFVLGGRSVGPWLTAFAYGTSYFSAVVFVGYAGQFGWKYGIASTWIGIGNAVLGSLLAWVVLGRRTKVMTQHLGSRTMPDFFGQRYDSKALKIVASVIVFVFLIPYTASVYNGLSRLFEMAFNIPYTWCVIVMAAFTAIYVILGGYMATAINDFIQGIIMLIGIVAVVAAVLSGQGGFMNAISEMSQIPSDVAVTQGQPGAFTSFFGPDPINLLGVVILTSLGTWGLPQMIGKFYAIKDEKSINTGTVISTLFAVVVSGGCYFLGGFGRLFDGRQHYPAYALSPSGHPDRDRGRACALGIHVHAVIAGADIQLYTDTGSSEGQCDEKHDGKEADHHHAGADRILYRNIRCHCP